MSTYYVTDGAGCRRRPQLTTDRARFTEAYAVHPARAR